MIFNFFQFLEQNSKYRDKIRFDVPNSCRRIVFNFKRDKNNYLLFNYSFTAIDFSKFVDRANVAVYETPTPKPPPKEEELIANKLSLEADEYCKNIIKSPEFNNIVKRLGVIESLLDEQDKYSSTYAREVENADNRTQTDNRAQQYSSYFYLLALNRFGPLVVVFFFSSLLITLYKYNSRLISFYYARLFAMDELDNETSIGKFSELVSIFSPDNLDYGKSPRTPTDIAGDIATKVAEKLDQSKGSD